MMSRTAVHPSRSTTIFSNIPASRHMLSFLREREGCDILNHLEETLHVDFRLAADSLNVHHDKSIPSKLIESTLKQKWHDCAMQRAMRVTLLQQACAHYHCDRFSVAQAALVSLFSHLIVRESGISDIIVETSGNVSCYGPMDCVNVARSIMDRLFHDHGVAGVLDTRLDVRQQYLAHRSNGVTVATPDVHQNLPVQMQSTKSMMSYPGAGDQHHWNGSATTFYSNSMTTVNNNIYTHNANYDQQSLAGSLSDMHLDHHAGQSISSSSHTRMSSSSAALRRKERIMFNVRSTDAPRLIGTRGINKKRIEETTGCAITLHTESKKDGEFPVEVMGATQRHVQQAKVYIETFLTNGGTALQEEEKKIRERPKVHLVFSPKKQLAPTPKKELSATLDDDY